jgi:hypothetical protein
MIADYLSRLHQQDDFSQFCYTSLVQWFPQFKVAFIFTKVPSCSCWSPLHCWQGQWAFLQQE